MQVLQAIAVAAAGVAAGTINTVVGSGTLITFPVLLAVGLPPVSANITNTLGLVPGSLVGAIGYRTELEGQTARIRLLGSASVLGALVGAILLLTLPPGAFSAIVPVLIVVALVLVVLQPWLAKKLATSEKERGNGGIGLWLGVFATGVYGGYFGAAQGVILLGLMGVLLNESLQRINGIKNVLAMLANLVAGILFIIVAPAQVNWLIVLLVAAGAAVGGLIGSKIGKKLPPMALRVIIVLVGVVAIVKLLV